MPAGLQPDSSTSRLAAFRAVSVPEPTSVAPTAVAAASFRTAVAAAAVEQQRLVSRCLVDRSLPYTLPFCLPVLYFCVCDAYVFHRLLRPSHMSVNLVRTFPTSDLPSPSWLARSVPVPNNWPRWLLRSGPKLQRCLVLPAHPCRRPARNGRRFVHRPVLFGSV